jgi:hypothetical protein
VVEVPVVEDDELPVDPDELVVVESLAAAAEAVGRGGVVVPVPVVPPLPVEVVPVEPLPVDEPLPPVDEPFPEPPPDVEPGSSESPSPPFWRLARSFWMAA